MGAFAQDASVVDLVADVLGYVESFATAAGERYRAKRLVARQGRFLVDGEFWSMNDALECLR